MGKEGRKRWCRAADNSWECESASCSRRHFPVPDEDVWHWSCARCGMCYCMECEGAYEPAANTKEEEEGEEEEVDKSRFRTIDISDLIQVPDHSQGTPMGKPLEEEKLPSAKPEEERRSASKQSRASERAARLEETQCTGGCGRPRFGSHTTCCTKCCGPDGPHSHDCADKARAAGWKETEDGRYV